MSQGWTFSQAWPPFSWPGPSQAFLFLASLGAEPPGNVDHHVAWRATRIFILWPCRPGCAASASLLPLPGPSGL